MTELPRTLSIRQAIDSGTWYECLSKTASFKSLTKFRIRFTSFRRIDLSEIDNPERISEFNPKSGVIWLLSFEVVSLEKTGLSGWEAPGCFKLLDSEGFEYPRLGSDPHLCLNSRFARKHSLRKFCGIHAPLTPKIVESGGVIYLLPDEDFAEYTLNLEYGSMREV